MPHHLRYQSTIWATHHVVSRCIQGFGFLKPEPEVVAICKGVLDYSLYVHRETVELHHYVFLSNHFHLLLSNKDTPSLAKFMCHFKSNLARELARINDWHSTLWENIKVIAYDCNCCRLRKKPVYCPSDDRRTGGMSSDTGFCREHGNLSFRYRGKATSGSTTRVIVPMRSTGTDQLLVVMKFAKANGAKGLNDSAFISSQPEIGRAKL